MNTTPVEHREIPRYSAVVEVYRTEDGQQFALRFVGSVGTPTWCVLDEHRRVVKARTFGDAYVAARKTALDDDIDADVMRLAKYAHV
jgi:hypothetical protein